MAMLGTTLELIEYVIVLVKPNSRKILVVDATGGRRLPNVYIPQASRPAEQLQKAVRTAWGLQVLILDILPTRDGSPPCTIAELLTPDDSSMMIAVRLDEILADDLDDYQRTLVTAVLSCDSRSPFSQLGWVDDAIGWIETATGSRLLSKSRIEQFNAGGAFSLVRFHMDDGSQYWLKATGEPNVHELAVTHFLSKLGGGHLPEMISFRPAWNAWLMSGKAASLTELPSDPRQLCRLLGDAVESMAALQMKTIDWRSDLLSAGAFDQSIDALRRDSMALFDCIDQAMSAQVSTSVRRVAKPRLQEIRIVFDDACRRMEDLDMPDTILHGDLNHGNILIGNGQCQFIDWCEAYIGNPLITLQHLLLLNQAQSAETKVSLDAVLKDKYKSAWLAACDPTKIDEGLVYMPIVAVASTLYGRGDWLASSRRNDPVCQKYVRNLVRHMDEAASSSELIEVLRP